MIYNIEDLPKDKKEKVTKLIKDMTLEYIKLNFNKTMDDILKRFGNRSVSTEDNINVEFVVGIPGCILGAIINSHVEVQEPVTIKEEKINIPKLRFSEGYKDELLSKLGSLDRKIDDLRDVMITYLTDTE